MAVTVSVVLLVVGVAVGVVLGKPLQEKTKQAKGDFAIDVRMPHVQPTVKDTYLCYAAPASKDATYITAFQPHGNMSYAHHILLYGCAEPGHDDVWDCGEMEGTGGGFNKAPVCKSGAQIIYAWAMDAPKLDLPKDVAFKIYGDSGINHLVLQVHYLKVDNFLPPLNHTDTSGLTLTATHTPQPKQAGVYLMGTGGEIPAQSTVYMETACTVNEPTVIHPFAFRAHAHKHGEVVSGYRVRDGKWSEIGRVSPKLPEMFYNVTDPKLTVKDGDTLAARCTMVNKEAREVDIGQTSQDEMCNFYMMYWVEGDHLMKKHYCFTPGPPTWSWNLFEGINSKNAPKDASVVPGTTKLLAATQQMAQEAEELLQDQDARLEEEVEQFLKQMQERFGENFIEESDEEFPERLLEKAALEEQEQEQMQQMQDYQEPFLEQRSLRGYEEPEMENLLSSLYNDGYNRADGALDAEEPLYDPRSLRNYPQPYNPWRETEEDNYY